MLMPPIGKYSLLTFDRMLQRQVFEFQAYIELIFCSALALSPAMNRSNMLGLSKTHWLYRSIWKQHVHPGGPAQPSFSDRGSFTCQLSKHAVANGTSRCPFSVTRCMTLFARLLNKDDDEWRLRYMQLDSSLHWNQCDKWRCGPSKDRLVIFITRRAWALTQQNDPELTQWKPI